MEKEIKKLIEKGESDNVEFKPSLSQLNDVVNAISGFANYKGGIILIGVSDYGKILGCEIGKGTIENLTNTIRQNIEPVIHPEISVGIIKDKKIIAVRVYESFDKPVLACGKLYKRVGKSTLLASRHEFEKLVLEKHKEKMRFDNQVCEKATVSEINKKTVGEFVERTKYSKRLDIKKESVDSLLKKLGLIVNNKLTNSGVLLFGKNPKKYFINNIIKCGRFKGVEKEEFIDIRDFDGNLFENLESSITFLKNHLRVYAKIEGIVRKENWEIPLEAFREAIINAMIHRDYTNPGFIYIKIYDSKIIISNPGRLPAELKIEDLYKEHESIPKNPVLAKIFYYTGLIDVWGRGSLNILESLKKEGLNSAEFEEAGGYFRITFKRPEGKIDGVSGGLTGGLTGGLKEVYETIKLKEGVQAKDLAKILDKSIDTLDKQIKSLVKKNLIIRKGSKKTGGYYIR